MLNSDSCDLFYLFAGWSWDIWSHMYTNVICWSTEHLGYGYLGQCKGKVFPLQARCGPEVGRGIALLFHDRGTRKGWVVSSTPRTHFTPGKGPVPILQESRWVPGPVWTGGKSRPHRDSIPGRSARSQSLYQLSYPAHIWASVVSVISDYWHWVVAVKPRTFQKLHSSLLYTSAMTSVMLIILRHETLTSLTVIFFPRFRLWAGRPLGVQVEQSSEGLSGKTIPADLQHAAPTNAKLISRCLCHFMCMKSSLTFQLVVQWSLYQREG